MLLAFDVYYHPTFAKSIAIEFEDWMDEQPRFVHQKIIPEVAEYIPGEFYKRELPCILTILEEIEKRAIECILIDGFVTLKNGKKPGLGRYLYEALDQQIPIIGVAKNPFKDNHQFVQPVTRGKSKKPLYITSVGMDLEEASQHIRTMVGQYRIPDLLRTLDQATRS